MQNADTTPKQKKSSEVPSPFLSFKKLDHAAEIAYYYGFMPIKPPVISRDDMTRTRRITENEAHEKNYGNPEGGELLIRPEEKTALLRESEEKRLLSPAQPAMLYYEGVVQRADHKRALKTHYKELHLDILGTGKSVAEAELIKTTLEILRGRGFEDLYVDINSTGDKDSLANFTREIQQFYRKHGEDLQTHCKTLAKKDPFTPLECENQKCQEASEQAPKSVAYLSEPSRLHFREVLEYLESMHVPYRIDNRVLGNRRVCCHTIFLIKTLNVDGGNDAPEETLALGYRYNGLAKKLDMKKEIPAIGVTIAFKETKGARKKCRTFKKPHVYFIQFGFDAKLKSFDVIEVLRRAHIPLYQSLAKDKLTAQIAVAENMGIPYVILMGQKEALEGTIIVRKMSTRMQETVKVVDLPEYLKKVAH